MKLYFDHEKLNVYQPIAFVAWADRLLNGIQIKAAAKDHLDRASTSVALNIAEGNGKFSVRDRSRFFEIARGSALECAACLDVLVAKQALAPESIVPGKETLVEIVSMLMGLLKSLASRVAEEAPDFGTTEE